MAAQTDARSLSPIWRASLAMLAVIFGVMTILSGGSVLFGDDGVRALAGDVVSVVLWVNFLAGFAYVIAGLGIWMRARWAFPLAVLIVGATLAAGLYFTLAVLTGAAFEMRTVGALALRVSIWAAIAIAIRPRRSRR